MRTADPIEVVTHVVWRSDGDYVAACGATLAAHAREGFDAAAPLREGEATLELGTYRSLAITGPAAASLHAK